MNPFFLRTWTCILLVGVGAQTGFAQRIPAWTRHITHTQWNQIRIRTPFSVNNARFLNLARRNLKPVKSISSVRRYVYHNVNYSQLFSTQEKKLLLSAASPQATLGKIVFLHNQHASYYHYLLQHNPTLLDEKAFSLHQHKLQEMLEHLRQHYTPHEQVYFSSPVFSSQQIAALQQFPSQPYAFALPATLLRQFAAQPTLPLQQQWLAGQIQTLSTQQHTLLKTPLESVSPLQFEQYYRTQLQLDYFSQLQTVLSHATQKRPSAIMRYKNTLPGQSEKLTDAQRAGKILWQQALAQSKPSLQWQREFAQTDGPYAVAEALGLPYEVALMHEMYAPELLPGGAQLRALPPEACLQTVRPHIAQLEQQLQDLHTSSSPTPSFYVNYFKIYATLQIYKGLEAKALFFLHHQK